VTLDDHIRRAPVRQRARVAEAFQHSEVPLLRAFASALITANAAEAAAVAELETELQRERSAELDAIAANLPEPGKSDR
jgi:hypothetical protein